MSRLHTLNLSQRRTPSTGSGQAGAKASCLRAFVSLFCAALASLAALQPHSLFSAAPQDPADYIYALYRTDYDGFGDDGTACPIARCSEGTVFVAFSNRKGLDRAVSQLEARSRGGPLPLWGIEASGEWIQGHQPKLVCYPVDVPTVPLFLDDRSLGVLAGARVECHEDAYDPVRISWEAAPLQTGQRDTMRIDAPYGAHTNHGDSSTPRFVRLPDGRLALLGQEITLLGTASNWPTLVAMLTRAKATLAPDLTWETVRWPGEDAGSDSGTGPAPELPPTDTPTEPLPADAAERMRDLEIKYKLLDLRVRALEKANP